MNDNNELVFAKGKDGHYRYISKKELKRQILPIRILTFCFYFIIFGVILGGAYYIFTDVYEVYLVKDNMLIDNGNAYQIELLPKNSKYFDYENYIYESDNPKIATVDKYGQITAVSNGTCNISVRYKYGIEKKTMSVDVRNIEVKTLTIDNDAVDKNNTNKAEVIVNNNESLKTKLTYKSSNEEVLKVDDNGNLVGVDEGKAKVTVTSPSGVTEEKTIEVKTSKDEIQEIKIKENDILLKKGESKKLTLSVVPSNASTKDVSWDSTDKSIVSVDQNGNIKALQKGTISIIVKTKNGLESVAVVCVEEDSELVLNTYNEELEVGDKINVDSNLDVEWKSSDPNVATVDQNGNINALKSGVVDITAVSSSGKKETVKVTIGPKVVNVKNIIVDEDIEMYKGQVSQIKYSLEPSDATNRTLTYSSSNPSVASVDQKGKITANNAGKCNITLKSSNGITANILVNVYIKNISAESIKFNKSEVDVYINDNIYLEPIVTPNNVTNKSFEFSSSNEAVATIDKYGRLIAKSAGKAVIKVRTENGKEAKILVNVTKDVGLLKTIYLNKKSINLYVNGDYKLDATLGSFALKNQYIKWTSTDSSVATVDQDGNVKALDEGTTIIVAQIAPGISSECEVTVSKLAVKSISINQKDVRLGINESTVLSASIEPANASDKQITWNSLDRNIVKVDSNGNITGIKPGKTTVSATSANGISDDVNVTVTEIIPTKIKITNSNLRLILGQEEKLKVSFTPKNATDKKLVFESDNTSVARVDTNGKVTAVGVGSTKLRAYLLSDKTIKSEIIVDVYSEDEKVESITIDREAAIVQTGNTIKLSAIITPKGAVTSITWSSSNPGVASVDQNGNVKGIRTGSTTISATTKNGKTSKCKITVVLSKVAVESIEITSTTQSIYVGDSVLLSAKVSPENATDKSVEWTSDNTSVATVDQNGTVKGIKEGTVKITAVSKSSKVKASKSIIVRNKPVAVSKITLNKTSATVYTDNVVKLSATIEPANATNKTLKWTSSDIKIATVDQNGTVKGIKAGKATITVISSDGKVSAKCSITVKEQIKVSLVSLNVSNKTIDVGESFQLIVTYTPSDVTDKTLTWTSSNEKVVSVDKNGNIKGLKTGQSTITATSSNGKSSTCLITVKEANVKVKSLTISTNVKTINVNESITLSVSFDPANATNKEVTWKSSNKDVIKVNTKGVITGVSVGEATITAISKENEEVYATKTIKVIIPATKITLDKDDITLVVGKTYTLNATVTPSGASVKYRSTNTAAATVDQKGKITAVKEGGTYIVVESLDGKISAKCMVHVKNSIDVTKISIDKSFVKLDKNGSDKITVTKIEPSNASDKTITWTSSNSNVVSVDANGNIKAKSQGAATITAASSNGKTASANIVVFGHNVIDSYESATLKYYIERPNNPGTKVSIPNAGKQTEQRYVLYRIWVSDAYNQMKTIHSRIVTGNDRSFPMVLVSKEVEKYSYQKKGMVSVNASGFGFSTGRYGNIAASYVLNAGNNGSRVTYDANTDKQVYQNIGAQNAGMVLYDSPTGTQVVMGLTKNNLMKYYNFNKKVENNNKLKETITNDGVKYTFNFASPTLIKKVDGKMTNASTAYDLASRTGLCQIDEHNFIILSTTMTPGQNNNEAKDNFRYDHGLSLNTMGAIFLNYGCIWGANLDGGGSQSHVWKKDNTNYYRYYDSTGKVQVYPNTKATYGLERTITDQLYFVEK